MIIDATGKTKDYWEKLIGYCLTYFACLF